MANPATVNHVFCGILNDRLKTAVCPLPDNPDGSCVCMWKHVRTGHCAFRKDEESITADEYAARVGKPPISDAVLSILKNSLLVTLKTDLAE